MSKKSLGLKGAHDHGAKMTANAQKLMPEIMAAAKMKGRAIPPALGAGALPGVGGDIPGVQAPTLPPDPSSMPPNGPGGMKKGGAACFAKGGKVVKFAAGGVAKVRHAAASSAGAPKAPKVKFRGKSGIGGG